MSEQKPEGVILTTNPLNMTFSLDELSNPLTEEDYEYLTVVLGYGLGIRWLYQLSPSHPFHRPAVRHDLAYELKEHGSSKAVDLIFLAECLEIAGDSLKLKAQAYLFYSLTRVWGSWFW